MATIQQNTGIDLETLTTCPGCGSETVKIVDRFTTYIGWKPGAYVTRACQCCLWKRVNRVGDADPRAQ